MTFGNEQQVVSTGEQRVYVGEPVIAMRGAGGDAIQGELANLMIFRQKATIYQTTLCVYHVMHVIYAAKDICGEHAANFLTPCAYLTGTPRV